MVKRKRAKTAHKPGYQRWWDSLISTTRFFDSFSTKTTLYILTVLRIGTQRVHMTGYGVNSAFISPLTNPLKHRRNPLAHANTHSGQSQFAIILLHHI